MTKPRLSICIATYNRAGYIGETLDSLLPQLTGEVEVVIVDGASTDDTAGVVGGYAAQCAGIRYVRLLEKGGVDKDYDLSVSHATGEYCWFFTDDDILNPGAVRAVLAQLDKGYPLIIVNACVKDEALARLLVDRKMPIARDIVYPPAEFDKFFVNTSDCLTFIGCVVIRRSLWLERERAAYYGLEFVHMGVIFQRPLPGPVLVMAEPHISIRLGNAQWTVRAFEIWLFKWPKLIWSFTVFPEEVRARVSAREPWRDLKKLVFLRAEGNYELKDYDRFIRPQKAPRWWQLAARAICAVPGVALNFLVAMNYKIRYPGRNNLFFALKNSKYYYVAALKKVFGSTGSPGREK
ncbi:MAG TPA: glycosyltransferase family 2 protein [Elusimicrobiales bacterium]|nr:glycosyltransferase family 2 protein [Elusimicrobiales bacterium]